MIAYSYLCILSILALLLPLLAPGDANQSIDFENASDMNNFSSNKIADFGRCNEIHCDVCNYFLALNDASCKEFKSVKSYLVGGPGTFRFNYKANGTFINQYEFKMLIGNDSIILPISRNWQTTIEYPIPRVDVPLEVKWIYKYKNECQKTGNPDILTSSICIDDIQLSGSLSLIGNCNCPAHIWKKSSDNEIALELSKPCDQVYIESGTNLSNVVSILSQMQSKKHARMKSLYLSDNGIFNGPLLINSGYLEIIGGHESKLLGSKNNMYIIIIDNSINIKLDNIILLNGEGGIFIGNSTKININNFVINNFNDSGIVIYNGTDIYLNDNEISSNKNLTNGIWLNCSSSNTLKWNIIDIKNFAYRLENGSMNNEISIKDVDRNLNIKDDGFLFWRHEGKYMKKDTAGKLIEFNPTNDNEWN